jgi:hypothetical protein
LGDWMVGHRRRGYADGRVGNVADHDHYFGLRFVSPANDLANNRRHYVVIDLAFEIDSDDKLGLMRLRWSYPASDT